MTINQATWNDHKAEIYELYYTRNYALDDVVHVIEQRRGFKASRDSYKRQFSDALTKRSGILNDPVLKALVIDLYYKNTSHTEILRVLRDFKGYPDLKDRQLREIRSKAGLIYRRQATLNSVSPIYEQQSVQ
jgi:Clr5 domain